MRANPRNILAIAILLLGLAVVPPAHAQVMQPDGTPIPCTACPNPLQSYLDARSEAINATTEAATEPERFVPGCTIHFTVVARDTGYRNSFGWYNVQSGRAPTSSELFELVPPDTTSPPMYGVGFTASLSVRTDPRYTGGDIGFYLTNGANQTFYSERAYQPDAQSTGGFIHVLIYNSHVTPQAFYFAWEDLFGGGDNDFQDLLMIVDNLVCSGGGAPCDTGMPGACAAGIQQCRGGTMTCVPLSMPSPERCDGIDNNCDGSTDEGTTLCSGSQICDRAQCVDRCVELACPEGSTCSDRGTCVEIMCANVNCPPGNRCENGQCVEACTGVTCPHGQTCRVGRCVDPCAGLTCDSESVCVAGLCQPRCPCHVCETGTTCATSGQCVSTGCESMTCGAGMFCQAGTCMDACQGTVCPSGQACQMGQCVDVAPSPDAGTSGDAGRRDGGTGFDGGRMDGGTREGGVSGDGGRADGSTGDGSTGLDGGTGGRSGGCGCRTAGTGSSGSAGLAALGLLGMVTVLARRRKLRAVAGRTNQRGN